MLEQVVRTVDELHEQLRERARRIEHNVLAPNVAASVRCSPHPPEAAFRRGSTQARTNEVTTWDINALVNGLPVAYFMNSVHRDVSAGMSYPLVDMQPTQAMCLMMAAIVLNRVLLLYCEHLERTNFGLTKCTSALKGQLGPFSVFITNPSLFNAMNQAVGGRSFIAFRMVASKPTRGADGSTQSASPIMAIKSIQCPHYGIPAIHNPLIDAEFLHKCGPSYGFVPVTLESLASDIGPTCTHFLAPTAHNVLNHEVPPMWLEAVRLGYANLASATEFRVHLAHPSEIRRRENSVPIDAGALVMIKVAEAPLTMPYYESWLAEAKHQIITTPGVMTPDGTALGGLTSGGMIPIINVVGALSLTTGEVFWMQSEARRWLKSPYVPQPGETHATPAFEVHPGGDADQSLLSSTQGVLTLGADHMPVSGQVLAEGWRWRPLMLPFTSNREGRLASEGTDTVLLASCHPLAVAMEAGPVQLTA